MNIFGRVLSAFGFPGIQSQMHSESFTQPAPAATADLPPKRRKKKTVESALPQRAGAVDSKASRVRPSTSGGGGVQKRKAARSSSVADYKKPKRRKKTTDAPSEETLAKRRAAVEKRKKTIANTPILDKERVEIVTITPLRMMNLTSGRVVAINSLEHQMALKFPKNHQYIQPVYLPPATGDCQQKGT